MLTFPVDKQHKELRKNSSSIFPSSTVLQASESSTQISACTQSSRIKYAAATQTEDGTERFCIPMETQMLHIFYLTSLLGRKDTLLRTGDCFCFSWWLKHKFLEKNCSLSQITHCSWVPRSQVTLNIRKKNLPYSGCCNDSYEENSPPA